MLYVNEYKRCHVARLTLASTAFFFRGGGDEESRKGRKGRGKLNVMRANFSNEYARRRRIRQHMMIALLTDSMLVSVILFLVWWLTPR